AGAETPPRLRFALRRVRAGTRDVETRAEVSLRWPSALPPPTWASPGTALRVRGLLRPLEDRRNPGGVAPGAWLARDGLEGTLDAEPGGVEAWSPERRERAAGPAPAATILAALRVATADRIEAAARSEAAALARGMLLGDRAGVAPETRESFRNAGTFHILSISGLHVCIVAGFMAAGARALGLGATSALAAELCGLAAYVVFVGAPPPALRSALLWSLTRGARFLGRSASPFAGWGAAGIVLHLADPALVHDLGFLLSFGAVLGLFAGSALTAGRAPDADAPRLHRWRHAIVTGCAAGAGAALGTLPVEAIVFGSVPVAGPVANLVVIPLTTLFLAESILLAAAVWLAPPPLLEALGGALDLAAALMVGANDLFGGRIEPIALHRAPPLAAAATAALALLGAAALAHAGAAPAAGARGTRARRWAAAGLLVAALLAALVPRSWTPRFPWERGERAGRAVALVALDVGQGDAALLLGAGASAVLVDAGPRSEWRDEGRVAIEPALRAEGVERVIAAISSHGHRDHEGGFLWLARRGWLDRVVENGGGSRDRDAWRSAVERRGSAVALAPGRAVRFGCGAWAVRVEGPRAGEDPALRAETAQGARGAPNTAENDRSLVASALAGGWSALFPGDVEEAGERAWLDAGAVGGADVLKVPHHGSRTSSTPEWVARVRPRVAIVSAGAGNRHGHPSPATLARYRRAGAWVVRTDLEGAIRITEVGGRLLLSTRAHPAPRVVPPRSAAAISPYFDFP
ncbi:MAG TPA: ComEC/Rec2 family competence protein, partial [Candidatus Eisenbacteria bacterium]|nr:ComEC/Rec2 family competence protein [Candidatus Eisenbacteria bacterium]